MKNFKVNRIISLILILCISVPIVKCQTLTLEEKLNLFRYLILYKDVAFLECLKDNYIYLIIHLEYFQSTAQVENFILCLEQEFAETSKISCKLYF